VQAGGAKKAAATRNVSDKAGKTEKPGQAGKKKPAPKRTRS
jgi:hypothetical protein